MPPARPTPLLPVRDGVTYARARALNPSSLSRITIPHVLLAPAAVNHNAGTLASFYYKHVREADLETRDALVAPAQDLKFTLAALDKQVYGFAVGMLEGLGLKKGHKIAVWMESEVELLVVRYAAGLLGFQVVSCDPAMGFDELLPVLHAERIRTLFMSPRYKGEDRAGELHTVFEEEIRPYGQRPGYHPFTSKRFRDLKHIVCTSSETMEGVVRFRDLPVYGDSEFQARWWGCARGEGQHGLPALS
jgi:hypothetical protein